MPSCCAEVTLLSLLLPSSSSYMLNTIVCVCALDSLILILFTRCRRYSCCGCHCHHRQGVNGKREQVQQRWCLLSLLLLLIESACQSTRCAASLSSSSHQSWSHKSSLIAPAQLPDSLRTRAAVVGQSRVATDRDGSGNKWWWWWWSTDREQHNTVRRRHRE